jgi:predicted alpha/beta hydrolase family esterase
MLAAIYRQWAHLTCAYNTMKSPVLLIPGIGNSGPIHWQTLWENQHTNTYRVQQTDWDHPDCDQWAARLEDAVRRADTSPVLVAHSLGCLVACKWAALSNLPVKAIMLVAVPDPTGQAFPKEATGFSRLESALGQRRIVMVSSTDDPFSTTLYSQQRALAWNAERIDLGAKGHINADSGLGEWSHGWSLVKRLLNEQ